MGIRNFFKNYLISDLTVTYLNIVVEVYTDQDSKNFQENTPNVHGVGQMRHQMSFQKVKKRCFHVIIPLALPTFCFFISLISLFFIFMKLRFEWWFILVCDVTPRLILILFDSEEVVAEYLYHASINGHLEVLSGLVGLVWSFHLKCLTYWSRVVMWKQSVGTCRIRVYLNL